MRLFLLATIFLLSACAGVGDTALSAQQWVVSWAASIQGPYPIGNPSAMPDMSRVFPTPANGARDQSFRLIVRPTLWGRETRIRMTNALGTTPVTFDGVYVGLQNSGAEVTAGTNRAITFGGRNSVTIAAGQSVWSDAVALPFVRDAASNELAGRKLAVSFHVAGESGPMTWHAKALQSSYVTWPGAGAKGRQDAHREARAHGRSAACRAARRGPSMMSLGPITLGHFLSLGAVLFALSVIGIFLNRKNLIVLLMAIELMLLAVNTNFIAFSYFLGDMDGQVFVFFILTVAAAESAIGLAILVVLFRNRETINVDELDELKG